MLSERIHQAKSKVENYLINIFSEKILINSVDDYLDDRDGDPFDADWMSAYKKNEEKKERLDEGSREEIDSVGSQVREEVFKISAKLYGYDLAGYISDDFGLIFDALVFDDNSPQWAYGLLLAYINGRMPSGQIPEVSVSEL